MIEGETRSVRPALAEMPRILVVSGHAATGEALARALEYFGYDVRLVAGVGEVLALVRRAGEGRVDLLICDAGPPVEAGVEAAGLLIRIQAERGTRGLAYGGYGEHGPEREEMLAAGFEDYLATPFTVDRLLAAVRRALARGPAPVGSKN